MKLGLALSPGGFLLPYHLGVLDSLSSNNQNGLAPILTADTALAGSSAGAIAVVCHACGLDSMEMIEATAELSAQCLGQNAGKTTGLVQGVRQQMQRRLIAPGSLNRHVLSSENDDNQDGDNYYLDRLQSRAGLVGVAYQELFPQYRPILQTEFDTMEDLIEAVCYSSTFPFFSTPFPCSIDTRTKTATAASPSQRKFIDVVPRFVLDGFFTVPRERFGCPDFNRLAVSGDVNLQDFTSKTEVNNAIQDGEEEQSRNDTGDVVVGRTVCVSCFPQSLIGLTAVSEQDCISPSVEPGREEEQIRELFRLATKPLEMKDGLVKYREIYENGFRDARLWVAREEEVKVGVDSN